MWYIPVKPRHEAEGPSVSQAIQPNRPQLVIPPMPTIPKPNAKTKTIKAKKGGGKRRKHVIFRPPPPLTPPSSFI